MLGLDLQFGACPSIPKFDSASADSKIIIVNVDLFHAPMASYRDFSKASHGKNVKTQNRRAEVDKRADLGQYGVIGWDFCSVRWGHVAIQS